MESRSQVFLVSTLLAFNLLAVSGQSWTIADIIPSGYDPKSTPNSTGINNVNIGVTINSITVTETTSSFQLDLTLKQKWTDNRLSLSPLIKQLLTNRSALIPDILLDSSYVSKFWTPDVYFQNALSVSMVNTGLPIQFIAIGINNNITLITRISGTFICKMDLTPYPQDYQYCSLEAVSLTKTTSQMQLIWDDFETLIQENSKFRIRKLYRGTCLRTSYLGSFSCQTATLKLVRRVSYYMIRVYAPTFLCVIITFVSFWIPIVGYPARVAIVLTPLLSLITQDIGLNNDIGVEYVVAIHWWMIWCQVFVYLALCEYALAISWAHFTNEKKSFKAGPMLDYNGNQMSLVSGHYFGNEGWFNKSGRIIDKMLYFFFGNVDYTKDPIFRNKVDYVSRIVFPFMWIFYVLLFIFATICPWAANYN